VQRAGSGTAHPTPCTTTVITDADSHETREPSIPCFAAILGSEAGFEARPFPHDNQSYLANYPALASFLSQHPEVAHSPAFYLSGISIPEDGVRRTAASGYGVPRWRE